ncbi:HesA/MoeB/ThiF family protein [Candidatus Bathyarchaeota archaeon]|nr:HesA/MoeB/ThiF family protein [Candidatus Bathyarchaeota archaeon]
MSILFKPEEYYRRQIALPEMGFKGQKNLRSSSVAIVGVGGLGSVSALYLALAGVGRIKLIDQDVVEFSNLHRQILYTIYDCRLPKAEVAAKRIRDVNPEVEVEPIPENLNELNAERLLRNVDCVVDGLDNMKTRYLINRVCVKHRIPYVFGGAIGLEGNVSVFKPPETPCLECILPGLNDAHLPTCETRGVIGATPGIVGAIQTMETIKLLIGVGGGLLGKLLVCDFKMMSFDILKLGKNPGCMVCGEGIQKPVKYEEKLIWLCGSDTVNVNPSKPMNIDLVKAHDILSNNFKILAKSSLALTISLPKGVEATIFRNGRMLIRNVKDEQTAVKTYEIVIQYITQSSSPV